MGFPALSDLLKMHPNDESYGLCGSCYLLSRGCLGFWILVWVQVEEVGVGDVLGSDMGGGGGGGCGWGVTDGLVEQSPSTVSSNLPFERATS